MFLSKDMVKKICNIKLVIKVPSFKLNEKISLLEDINEKNPWKTIENV